MQPPTNNNQSAKASIGRERSITDYDFFRQLCALSYVQAIYLFGSRSRGDSDEWSDVDLAVFCPEASTEQWLNILEIVREPDILVEVQCLRFDQLQNEEFKAQVNTYKSLLYQRDCNG